MAEVTFNATVVYREDLTSELSILRVAPNFGEIPEFDPGQYAELAIPTLKEKEEETPQLRRKFVRRAYSIASPPSVREYVELCVVLVEDGELTPKLWPQAVGDSLWLGPKIKGKFTLDPIPPERSIIMVATGTGVAPFVSMIRAFHGTNRWKDLVLIHSARFSAELAYGAEMEELARKDRHFHYLPTLTREPENSGWNGLRGRVQQFFEADSLEAHTGFNLDPAHCHVMLCGNPAMIESVQPVLENRGFREHTNKIPGTIHFERYW